MKSTTLTVSATFFLILSLSAHPILAATIHVPVDQPTIQGAVDAAVDRDFVLVAPGTYFENIDFLGKTIAVLSEAGAEVTIIDGSYSGSVVTFESGETGAALIGGFTLQNGNASYGGGIYCSGSSPTITNCTISENNADNDGGGIYFDSSSSTIAKCTVSGNIAGDGGGIYCYYSDPTLKNCTISLNSAIDDGGGIYCFSADPTITNCTISGNSVTFGMGGGIYAGGTYSTITNCILWGNSNPDIFTAGGSLRITYSDVKGGWPGEGNIVANPSFVGGGDFHLTAGSACIDTGKNTEIYSDIDWDVRPHFFGFDMGSDEYSGECWDLDEDGYSDETCGGYDCDDSDPVTNPGAADPCDGVDQACDGLGDERDFDKDLFMICEGDCDDFNRFVYPGAFEICDGKDSDCDGAIPDDESDEDGDGWILCRGDCDDTDPDFNPGVHEVCDDIDWDCSGEPFDKDVDRDGHIDIDPICGGDDCDDFDPEVYPGARELCDGKDSDCDGFLPLIERDLDRDWWKICNGDCDDTNPDVNPGVHEVCDDIDWDCSGDPLDKDVDGDGYLDDDPVCMGDDCDDSDPEVHPGADEICDGIDWDCSGSPVDKDIDRDGFFDDDPACMGDDCDDADPVVNPGADEICDGKDTDCDGTGPAEEVDDDGDGYMNCEGDCDDTDPVVNPGAVEGAIDDPTCSDGKDNDCDGLIDTDPECIEILVPGEQSTIQDAINAAEDGNTILVSPGTYRENISFVGKGIKVHGVDGPIKTIIDGGRAGSAVTFRHGETAEAVLDGFTIQNGSGRLTALPSLRAWLYAGGGIHCEGAAPTITNCMITNNYANLAGGIFLRVSTPTITNCMIVRNRATGFIHGGGGIYLEDSSPTITNCTFSGNFAGQYGGAIFCYDAYPRITNSILWGNSATYGSEIYVESGVPVVTYSDVKGIWPGEGNIGAPPSFVGGVTFHLRPGSPCVDRGTDAGVYTDIDGQQRPWGAGFDMGADEFSTEPCSVIASSGNQFVAFYLFPVLAFIFFRRRYVMKTGNKTGLCSFRRSSSPLVLHGILTLMIPLWIAYIALMPVDEACAWEDYLLEILVESIPDYGYGDIAFAPNGDIVFTVGAASRIPCESYIGKLSPDGSLGFFAEPCIDSLRSIVFGPPTGFEPFTEDTLFFTEGAGYDDDLYITHQGGSSSDLVLFVQGKFTVNRDLVYDPFANLLYLADVYKGKVFSITASGEVTDLASVPITDDHETLRMDVDSSGTLYLAHRGTGEIYAITPSGETSVFTAAFPNLQALAIDDRDLLYIVDDDSIYAMSLSGEIVDFVTGLPYIERLAFDSDDGLFGIADGDIVRIRCWGFDFDGDGHDSPVCDGFDCDDTDPLSHPEAAEMCDGKDNDCDDLTDEDFEDADWDGTAFCLDCDDTDPAVNPEADEICDNEIDDDCDGLVDLHDLDCGIALVPEIYSSIQAGIDAVSDGDLVLVSPGIYRETISFYGKDITVKSVDGPIKTIIDGGRDGSVVTLGSGETKDAVLDGFTIQNGSGTFITLPYLGAGFYCGGGVFCWGSTPTITNCMITNNYAYLGGGIYLRASTPTITNCMIVRNRATGLIHGGGGLYLEDSSPAITNCSVGSNFAGQYGGGIFCWSSSPTITNSILWGDFSIYDPEIHVRTGSPVVTYSDVEGGWSGEGNIDANPSFAGGVTFHLRPGSPCVDSGTDAGVYTDMDGQRRPWGSGFDIGADEFSTEPCSVIASSGGQFFALYLIPVLAFVLLSRRWMIMK